MSPHVGPGTRSRTRLCLCRTAAFSRRAALPLTRPEVIPLPLSDDGQPVLPLSSEAGKVRVRDSDWPLGRAQAMAASVICVGRVDCRFSSPLSNAGGLTHSCTAFLSAVSPLVIAESS